ncbi:MAG: HEPN domain-containing protein [Leptospiraceae bacterium]|nr:HEPN domain-containing protein [Leptospiraceae bacterium]MBK7053993.1 HEPN domain-containing protein [Leptospiraceae bacterium]
MLVKAKSKLKTARIDFENGQFEDSISRSYYCAFNAISALLLTKNLNFSSHN